MLAKIAPLGDNRVMGSKRTSAPPPVVVDYSNTTFLLEVTREDSPGVRRHNKFLDEGLRSMVREFSLTVAKRPVNGVRFPVSREQVALEAEFAGSLMALVAGRRTQLDAFAEEVAGFDRWIDRLPDEMAHYGAAEEALALWNALRSLRPPEWYRPLVHAQLLGKAGRNAEGVAILEADLAERVDEDGENPDFLDATAEALMVCSAWGRAEDVLRRALSLHEEDDEEWAAMDSADSLALVLEEQRRGAEAEAVRAKYRIVRGAPCRCGNGRSYESCHGMPSLP